VWLLFLVCLCGQSASDGLPDLRRIPKASTLVAAGDLFAGEADADPKSPIAARNREQARRMYEQALSVEPGNLPAFRGLAHLCVAMNNLEGAVETYHKALDVHPKDASLWFDLGMVQARRQEWDLAVDALSRASNLDTNNERYANTLGHVYARSGHNEEALSCFRRFQGEAGAHFTLARMLDHLGKTEQAKEQLRLALHTDPHFLPAVTMLDQLEGGDSHVIRPPGGAAPTPPSKPKAVVGDNSDPTNQLKALLAEEEDLFNQQAEVTRRLTELHQRRKALLEMLQKGEQVPSPPK
jgi:tetratricopeptide (TPR) repeat protein